MGLGAKIKALREERKLSLQQLADKADTSKTYLWQLENEQAEQPSAQKLLAIAKALGTTIGALLGQPTVQINDDELEIPPSLAKFLDDHPEIPDAEKRMLASIQHRGKRPTRPEDWQHIYETIKRFT